MNINKWFNNLNVRILGTPEEPYFYATDIAKVLEISNYRSIIANYGENEVLSNKERQKVEIKDSGGRNNKNILLLTEFGVYRLLFASRKLIAQQFREFVYETLRKIRLESKELLNIELEEVKDELYMSRLACDFQQTIIKKYREAQKNKY